MLTESFISQGVPKGIAEDFAGAIARDKALKSGEDGLTIVDRLTPKQKDQIENTYHTVLKEYGYTGDIYMRRKKVAGTKSKLRYGVLREPHMRQS